MCGELFLAQYYIHRHAQQQQQKRQTTILKGKLFQTESNMYKQKSQPKIIESIMQTVVTDHFYHMWHAAYTNWTHHFFEQQQKPRTTNKTFDIFERKKNEKWTHTSIKSTNPFSKMREIFCIQIWSKNWWFQCINGIVFLIFNFFRFVFWITFFSLICFL